MRVNGAIAVIFLLGRLTFAAAAQKTTPPVVDPSTTDPGWIHFYNNEFDDALIYFEQQLKEHPQEPEKYNHVAQAILYREMLRNGALESQLVSGNNPFLRRAKMEISAEDKQRFEECLEQSVKLSEAALKQNPRDIHALEALGVAHVLRSNFQFLVEKAWMDALHEATAARKANEQILAVDPSNVDAHLVLGLNAYVVGSLPFYMRMLGFLGGFHGDKQGGLRQMELVAAQGERDRYDAEVVLAAIYRRERMPQKALPLLQDMAAKFPRNYLYRYELVQMYSDTGDKASALRVLGEIEDLRHKQAPGYANLPLEKIRYMKGNLLFWYGDLAPALEDLKQVTLKANELDLNTAVLAWLRVGQIQDLLGRRTEAIEAYRETVKTAPKSEAAAEAKGYMSNPYRRRKQDSTVKG
jgi:tetratricopeptide (TPR) repeat protein